MPEKSETASIPPTLKQISANIRLTGWISFWLQLVLGVIASLIFLFALLLGQNASSATANNSGTLGAAFFAVLGLFVLYFSVYQAFSYTRIANKLQDPNANFRPKKADTIKNLRLGLKVSLAGMLLSVLGAEAITGTLLGKSLAVGQGAAVFNPETINKLIQPLDIFVVLANTHTIAAHFAGILTSLWLLNRITKQ